MTNNPNTGHMSTETKSIAAKITKGTPVIVSDAQGPMGLMHPTEKGVAICWFDDAFMPRNGFVNHPTDRPDSCPESYLGTTYHPERVANVRMVQEAFIVANETGMTPRELLEKLREAVKLVDRSRNEAMGVTFLQDRQDFLSTITLPADEH